MPSVIIKPDGSQDFYVYWSTVTDGPMLTGTRAELADHWMLARDSERGREGESAVDRLNRADTYGSSALPIWGFGHWSYRGFVVRWDHTGEHEVGPRYLPRRNLYAWAMTGDESLTEPVEP